MTQRIQAGYNALNYKKLICKGGYRVLKLRFGKGVAIWRYGENESHVSRRKRKRSWNMKIQIPRPALSFFSFPGGCQLDRVRSVRQHSFDTASPQPIVHKNGPCVRRQRTAANERHCEAFVRRRRLHEERSCLNCKVRLNH